jgi:hypothetical protein
MQSAFALHKPRHPISNTPAACTVCIAGTTATLALMGALAFTKP